MAADREADSILQCDDRPLEWLVVERHNQPTAVADEVVVMVVMVLAAVFDACAFVACDPVADIHAGNQSQLYQQLDAAVHAGDPDRPRTGAAPVGLAQPPVHLLDGEGAALAGEQVDQLLAGSAAPAAGAP